jgi:hypothetical protein
MPMVGVIIVGVVALATGPGCSQQSMPRVHVQAADC